MAAQKKAEAEERNAERERKRAEGEARVAAEEQREQDEASRDVMPLHIYLCVAAEEPREQDEARVVRGSSEGRQRVVRGSSGGRQRVAAEEPREPGRGEERRHATSEDARGGVLQRNVTPPRPARAARRG